MASLKKCDAKSRPLFIFLVFVVLLSTSSFFTSPPNFAMGGELPEDTASSSQTKEDLGISMKKLCFMKKTESPCPSSSEESAREVPTGPDPLHHNDKPIRP